MNQSQINLSLVPRAHRTLFPNLSRLSTIYLGVPWGCWLRRALGKGEPFTQSSEHSKARSIPGMLVPSKPPCQPVRPLAGPSALLSWG